MKRSGRRGLNYFYVRLTAMMTKWNCKQSEDLCITAMFLTVLVVMVIEKAIIIQ
jgi:hypothetical protein